MEFKIYDTIRYNTSGSLDDVVFFVRYGFEESGSSAKSGVLNDNRKTYFKELSPIDSGNFVNHSSVNESVVKGWITDGYGSGWGSFTSSIQTEMTNDLNSRSSSSPTSVIWWATGSQNLNTELLESGSQVTVPFTYADDAERLSHFKKMAGFTTNGFNVQSNHSAQEPAVVDIHRTTAPDNVTRDGTYRSNAQEVIGMGEGQYFPFTFSTVNKKNNRMQVCALQATMQSLSESYTPTWQSKHFFGRSEQVHTYTFTDRTIDLSFVIFADSMRQLQNVYERVLWLAQQCYPDYSSEDRIGSGPIIAMRVGDLFQYKSGFIRSLAYDWSFLGPGGKWELTQGMRMPQACNVTMSYQIIHEKVPDRDYDFYGGPAGGLAAGVKSQRKISWNDIELDVADIEAADDQRYIPSGTVYNGIDGPDIGERVYLDHIENTNSARFDTSIIPADDAIDQFTGDIALAHLAADFLRVDTVISEDRKLVPRRLIVRAGRQKPQVIAVPQQLMVPRDRSPPPR